MEALYHDLEEEKDVMEGRFQATQETMAGLQTSHQWAKELRAAQASFWEKIRIEFERDSEILK